MSLGVEGVDPMAEVWPDDNRVDGAGEKWQEGDRLELTRWMEVIV